jgi:hypothetical protein
MKLTQKENLLLRRALDKATTPAEAQTAARAFVESLRARGVNGYDFVPADRSGPAPKSNDSYAGRAQSPPPTKHPEPPPPPVDPAPPQWTTPPQQRQQSSGTGCLSRIIGLMVLVAIGSLWNQCQQLAHTAHTPTPAEQRARTFINNIIEHGSEYAKAHDTPTPTPHALEIGDQVQVKLSEGRTERGTIRGIVQNFSELNALPGERRLFGDVYYVTDAVDHYQFSIGDGWLVVFDITN